MTKSELRKSMTSKRDLLSSEEVTTLSHQIHLNLFSTNEFAAADAIYTFVSFRTEVETIPVIEKCLSDGKKVAVPKVIDKENMQFYYITDISQLQSGYYGIPEPVSGELASDKNALILMPGLAFDRKGNRIGYGGGFYDRYLASNPNCDFFRTAVAYDFQVVDCVPADVHDKKLDMIITPSGIILPESS